MQLTSTFLMRLLVVIAMGSVLWLCGCDRTAQPNTDKPPPVTPPEEVDIANQELAPSCEIERQRFVLLDGHWQSECLEAPIPRNSSIWTSDGHRVAVLANEKCDDTEEQKVFVLRNEEVRQTSVRIERRVGRGGGHRLSRPGIVDHPRRELSGSRFWPTNPPFESHDRGSGFSQALRCDDGSLAINFDER